jgi:hypothetical protein
MIAGMNEGDAPYHPPTWLKAAVIVYLVLVVAVTCTEPMLKGIASPWIQRPLGLIGMCVAVAACPRPAGIKLWHLVAIMAFTVGLIWIPLLLTQ